MYYLQSQYKMLIPKKKKDSIPDSQALFQTVLSWLQDSVVKPIFEALHEVCILIYSQSFKGSFLITHLE
jgi:hypothetical protein